MSDMQIDNVAESILGKLLEDGDGDSGADTGHQERTQDIESTTDSIVDTLDAEDGVDSQAEQAQNNGEAIGSDQTGNGEVADEASTAKAGEQSNSAIAPPVSWKAEAKAKFQALPPELQRYISDRESERERGISEAQRKSAEAAKAAEAQAASVQAERAQYAERLGHILTVATNLDPRMAEWQKRDWAKYAAEHPLESQSEWFTYQQQSQVIRAAQAEKTRIQEQTLREHRAKAHDELSSKLDFWKDDTKRKADQLALRDWAKGQGFSDGDVNGIEDARSYIVARKAMLYDKLMAEQSKIAAAKAKPPAPKRVMRSQSTEGAGSNPRADALARRAAKTGRMDDLADSVLARL